jgi:hypothetical protein
MVQPMLTRVVMSSMKNLLRTMIYPSKSKCFMASGIFLLTGMAVYFLFRNTNMLLFRWFPNMRWLNKVYFPLNSKKSVLVSFFVYTLPDGLWLLSGIMFLRAVWRRNHKISNVYALVFCLIAVLFEMFQLFEKVPGTFDVFDLILLVSIAFIEGIIFRYSSEGGQYDE